VVGAAFWTATGVLADGSEEPHPVTKAAQRTMAEIFREVE
jgi:hypothetical protein